MRYLFASAGITDQGLHSLRHTAATAMVNGGASFKDVSDVLGHKSITTTLIYAKLDLKSPMRWHYRGREGTMNFRNLSAHAEEFLALKRVGAKVDPHRNTQDRRSLKHREKLVRSFIAYWRDRGCPWPIRSSLLVDWIAVGSHRHHPYRDQRRFYVVRAFLQQIRIFEPATEIPENIYRPLYRRRTPHLYSEDDIARLMDAVWRLQTVTPFRRATVYALIGLLARTGLSNWRSSRSQRR